MLKVLLVFILGLRSLSYLQLVYLTSYLAKDSKASICQGIQKQGSSLPSWSLYYNNGDRQQEINKLNNQFVNNA